LAVGLDTVLQAEEFPAGIADLDASLADVDADSLTHLVGFLVSELRSRRNMTWHSDASAEQGTVGSSPCDVAASSFGVCA